MYRMNIEAMRYGNKNMYTLDEMLTDIDSSLWSELRSAQPVISSNRRVLQKKWIENVKMVLKDATITPQPGSSAPDITTTDIPVIVRSHMEYILKQCRAAAPRIKDPMTLAHIGYVQTKLTRMLDPKS
jgi:hypothetical protein